MNYDIKRLEHPNPQFMREGFTSLNGEWEFAFDYDDAGAENRWFDGRTLEKRINVPFACQSELSGIAEKKPSETVWYARTVECEKKENERCLLHFEACDHDTDVWVNGLHIGGHRGGFTPFTLDITGALKNGCNRLAVRAHDSTSPAQLIGKQSWKNDNFLCWYTRTTGIWQSVWLENVPKHYISHARITPNIDSASVALELELGGGSCTGELSASVRFKGEFISGAKIAVKGCHAALELPVGCDGADFRVEYWTPETPNLYDLELEYSDESGGRDNVSSYFGMRKIAAENGSVLLNNKVFYQKLVLNQGYWRDGLMTAPNAQALVDDVEKIKKCGFNGMRMHQKIEDSRLLYLCDCCGLAAWGEMPSFFRLETSTYEDYYKELGEAIKKLYNHPSVIALVLFNESWGVHEVYANAAQQRFVNGAFGFARSLDATRLIIGNDGWEHTKTDVLTIHDYTQEPQTISAVFADWERGAKSSLSVTSQRANFARGCEYSGQPVIISEYGGIAKSDEESASWGYGRRAQTTPQLLERIAALTDAIMRLNGVCGLCYTQWTDIEQEVNGILDARHNEKYPLEEIRKILDGRQTYGYRFE